jgi:hypothetical protein
MFCVPSRISVILELVFEPLVGNLDTKFPHRSFFDSLVGQFLAKHRCESKQIGIVLDAIEENYPRLKELCHELGGEENPVRAMKLRWMNRHIHQNDAMDMTI